MRSDAARNRAPRATTADMTERAIGATFDFDRAAAAIVDRISHEILDHALKGGCRRRDPRIVAGSDPSAELAETQAKFAAFRAALEG